MAIGSIRQRRPGCFTIVFDLGSFTDPVTGRRRRKQQTLTVHGTRQDAEARLREVMVDHDNKLFVRPSKIPLIDYLRQWHRTSAVISRWRPATIRLYRNVIEKHIAKHPIAFRRLEELAGSHIESYLASLTDSAPASVAVHRAVLHRALKRAKKDRLLKVNPAVDLEVPAASIDTDVATTVREHCWGDFEARRFVQAAQQQDRQTAAYMLLALDSGARRSELDGLGWQQLDLERGMVTFERQLVNLRATSAADMCGPPKTKRSIRTIALMPETVAALDMHRVAQAALKLRNGVHYHDYGLVFAKEDIDAAQRPAAALGQPIGTLGAAKFHKVVKAAGIRRIKFHGLRHTCASLLLADGVPANVVAARLGHSKTSMTLDIYGHVLPGQQQDAAARLGSILHGPARGRA